MIDVDPNILSSTASTSLDESQKIVIKKSQLKLNEWNTISIRFAGDAIEVYVNHNIRLKLNLTPSIPF